MDIHVHNHYFQETSQEPATTNDDYISFVVNSLNSIWESKVVLKACTGTNDDILDLNWVTGNNDQAVDDHHCSRNWLHKVS